MGNTNETTNDDDNNDNNDNDNDNESGGTNKTAVRRTDNKHIVRVFDMYVCPKNELFPLKDSFHILFLQT